MKKDYTIGIISGVILTIIGALIQFYLIKQYENNKNIQRLDFLTIRQLDNRLTRSNTILKASNSSVFKDRWNKYIYDVVYPWNANIYIIEANIKKNHPELYQEIKDIHSKFKEIHKKLNEIRKLQNPHSAKNKTKLHNLESEVEEKLNILEKEIYKLKKRLQEMY